SLLGPDGLTPVGVTLQSASLSVVEPACLSGGSNLFYTDSGTVKFWSLSEIWRRGRDGSSLRSSALTG
ncbi:MAG: hypothetical protein KTR32_03855, partial [Granulosicoccus sp.]|nr:hypothetical protein [Granulosicoccus sp.]